VLKHLLEARGIFRHVDVLHENLALAVLLTGGRGVGSGVFPKNEDHLVHEQSLLVRSRLFPQTSTTTSASQPRAPGATRRRW
jgi:hypothetical protein